MKIADGNRHTRPVKAGLVDDRGVFFLLLDDNETAYYRFSDESDLIYQLKHDEKVYRERSEKLEEAIHDIKLKLSEWEKRSDKYRRDFNKAESKNKKLDRDKKDLMRLIRDSMKQGCYNCAECDKEDCSMIKRMTMYGIEVVR